MITDVLKNSELKVRSYVTPELIVFQGDTPSDILQGINTVLKDKNLETETFGSIKQLSYDSLARYSGLKATPAFRAAVTAYGEAELMKKLLHMRKMIAADPQKPFSHPSTGLFFGMGEPCGKLAYLFPGQGAQYLGMGGPLADTFPRAARVWEKLGGMRFDGRSVKDVVFPRGLTDDASTQKAFLRLSGADWTNTAISVTGEAIFTLFESMGVKPNAVAGHSFGDINTFRAAGILSPEGMIHATRYRGELGVSCPLATRGCILVVPDTAKRTREVLSTYSITEAWIANHNTSTQTVLSGVKQAIIDAQAAFEKEGIRTRLIPISAAPHCPLAVDVAEAFAQYLETVTVNPADCDVYSFVFGRRIKPNDPGVFRKVLRAQIEKPVRFMQQIQAMYENGVRIFVEVGPSDILTGLVRQILDGKPHRAVPTDDRKGDPVLAFLNATAELFMEGWVNDFETLWQGYTIPHQAPDDQTGNLERLKDKHLKMLDLEFARIDREKIA